MMSRDGTLPEIDGPLTFRKLTAATLRALGFTEDQVANATGDNGADIETVRYLDKELELQPGVTERQLYASFLVSNAKLMAKTSKELQCLIEKSEDELRRMKRNN